MQIGEFAKVCSTQISVLRHYDKAGLLRPVFTDPMTGYRYYAKEQITEYLKIVALKKAGFTLPEIRTMLTEKCDAAHALAMFQKKKEELEATLRHLDAAEKTLLGDDTAADISVLDIKGELKVRAAKAASEDLYEAFRRIDKAIRVQGYQRISRYSLQGAADVTCAVVKLQENAFVPRENIDLPFVHDETVIGKWEILGEYAVREDFDPNHACAAKTEGRFLYFLPGGERYWCYGWTKGKLLVDDGEAVTVDPYQTECINGQHYMFVSFKSFDYRRGGRPTTLVLRRLDHRAYKEEDIRRKDPVDLPFVPDEHILGSWRAVAFCGNKEDFDPDFCNEQEPLYFAKVEFFPDGQVTSYYAHGTEVIGSEEMQTWTKGYLLRKWNQTACAYVIREINGKDYLFLEWKSGDYRWGDFDTDYYVFVRA